MFVSDDDWQVTLAAVHDCLRPGGWFTFETRRPEVRDWERWNMAPTSVGRPDGTSVVVSRTVTKVALPLVSFESLTAVDGEVIASPSTLRFRARHEVEQNLGEHGFETVGIRDASDRPGKELVFLARRTDHESVPSAAPRRAASLGFTWTIVAGWESHYHQPR